MRNLYMTERSSLSDRPLLIGSLTLMLSVTLLVTDGLGEL
jgi:hypothetical protein